MGAVHPEILVEIMRLRAFAIRSQRHLVASVAAGELERLPHQQIADSDTTSARIDHHVFYNRRRPQSSGQVPEDQDVIRPYDATILDRDQEDLVVPAEQSAQCAAHPGIARAPVVAFMELPVEIFDSALIAEARSTNSNLLWFHLKNQLLSEDSRVLAIGEFLRGSDSTPRRSANAQEQRGTGKRKSIDLG